MAESIWQLYQRQDDDLLQHLCRLRGISFDQLAPNYQEHLHDPNLLPGMKEARQLIKTAVKKHWQVTVFGDYDADGTPAAALLSRVLKRLDISHQVILPTRTTGYGLNNEVIESIKDNTQLLITVDTGITAVAEIALAKKYGIKSIVIDHHLPKDVLPVADSLIDPFISDSKYPFPYLCGCALAYKLTTALMADFPDRLTEGFVKWLLDLVAISTVADMMPIVGENRVLVHFGLQVLAKSRNKGLVELMKFSGLNQSSLNSYSLGFALGPRLNASGRLEDNRPAYDLLVTDSFAVAKDLARQIENANRQRQDLVKDVQKKAEKLLWQQNDKSDRFLVVYGEDWPAGVLGLVAGKIAAIYNRPTAVMSHNEDIFSGSARSISAYSLIDGLNSVQKSLSRFGGHRQAAGLAVSDSQLNNFIKLIKQDARNKLSPADLKPTLVLDAQLNPEEIVAETAATISQLQPFGQENNHPVFFIDSITAEKPRRIGADGSHLKLSGLINGKSVDMVGFGLAERYFAQPLNQLDIAGVLEINSWNNRQTLQIKIKDFRPAGAGVDEKISLPNQ